MEMNVKTLLQIVLILGFSHSISAQYAIDEYYQEGELKYEDHIYKAGIRGVKFHPLDNQLGMPIIRLNSGDRLRLTFDDLFADFMNMSYTIEHCNADWTPSNLLKQEYVPNLQDSYIEEYEYSINALVPYTNYQLLIPNNDMQILKSGNYMLKVYMAGDKDDLVLTRRFMVYEERVTVGGNVKRATRVEYMNERQEVDFVISHSDYEIQNPFTDLNVHLMKNNRWDNAILNLKPQYIQNSQLIYQYDKENTFKGGNEYRFFDIKNMQSLTQNVSKIDRDSVYTAYLFPDKPRQITNYTLWEDINGQYLIRRLDATNSDLESDYVYVDFLLKYPSPIETSDVYVFGRFTDWKLLPEYRMKYDYGRGAYHLRVPLKQGYYNYMYAVYEPGKNEADVTKIEGSHWQTGNTYQILVYNREVGKRYDRLIGFVELSSEDLF